MKSLILASLPPLLIAAQEVVDAIPGFDWGTISATSLLGWYLWYTTKVVFPNHQERVSEMQDSFTEQFNSQRDHYEKILEDVQNRSDKRHEQIVESLDKITACLDAKEEE
jgi:hypothetical protein